MYPTRFLTPSRVYFDTWRCSGTIGSPVCADPTTWSLPGAPRRSRGPRSSSSGTRPSLNALHPSLQSPPVMCVPYLQHPGCEISYLDSCCPLCLVLDRGLCGPGGDTGDIWLTGGPWGTDLGVTATLLLMGMCGSQDRDEI